MAQTNNDPNHKAQLFAGGQPVCRCGKRHLTAWQGLVLVVALAAVLRGIGLGERDFFGDEIFSINIAHEKTVLEIIHFGQTEERHPFLPHVISRLVYLAGAENEVQWRLTGLVSGIVLAATAFFVPLLLGNRRIALLTGLLVAASPLAVLFSQNNRWYPIAGMMLGLACLFLIIGAVHRRLWGWIAAGVCLAVTFYIVYLGAAVALVLLGLALVYCVQNHQPLRGWWLSVAAFIVLIAPWLPYLVYNLLEGNVHLDPVQSSFPLAKAVLLLQNLAIGPTVLPWNLPVIIPALVLLAVLAWSLLRCSDRSLRAGMIYSLVFILSAIPVFHVVPTATSPRYWLVLLIPWGMLVAMAVAAVQSKTVRGVILAALAAVHVYGLANIYLGREYQYQELVDDWRGLTRLALEKTVPEDEAWSLASPFVYYYGRSGREVLFVGEWPYAPEEVDRSLAKAAPQRVLLQYSPLSGWEGTGFAKQASVIGERLAFAGYRKTWEQEYGEDPDVLMKRRYLKGRDWPLYRHRLEIWERNAPAASP